MRQLGGSVGIAISATLVSRFAVTNHAALAENITRFNETTRDRIRRDQPGADRARHAPRVAEQQAIAILNGEVTRQALMLSYERLFLLFGSASYSRPRCCS